jgi:hypothetical protein
MGDNSKHLADDDPAHAGYQSPENRRLEAIERRLDNIEGDVDRLLKCAEARAKERAASSARMMRALNGIAED